MKKLFYALLLVVCAFGLVACKKPSVTDVTISGPEEVVVGQTIQLTATVTPEDAEYELVWGTSDETKATVNDGVVTGVSAGLVTITVKAGDKSAEVTVMVKAATVDVTGVTITGDTQVGVGGTLQLTAVITPENATDKNVVWSSSDETKATVKNGVVTGVSEGKATITATVGGKSATLEVTVTAAVSKTLVVHYQNWTGEYDNTGLWTWGNASEVAGIGLDSTDSFGAVYRIPLSSENTEAGLIVMNSGFDNTISNGSWNNAWVKGTGDVKVDVTEFVKNNEEEMHVYVFYSNGQPLSSDQFFVVDPNKTTVFVMNYDGSGLYPENLGVHAWGDWEFIYNEDEVAGFGQWATPACIFKTAAYTETGKPVKVGQLQVEPSKFAGSGFLVYAGDDASKVTPDQNTSDYITEKSEEAGVHVLYTIKGKAFYGEGALADFTENAFALKFDEFGTDENGNYTGTYAPTPKSVIISLSSAVSIADKDGKVYSEEAFLGLNKFKLYVVEGETRTLVAIDSINFSDSELSASAFVINLSDANKLDNTKKYVLTYQETEEAEAIEIEIDMDTEAPELEFIGDETSIEVEGGAATIQLPTYIANDDRDGEITNKVYVSATENNKVNTSVKGNYKVVLIVEDKWGNETTLELTVVVKDNSSSGKDIDLSVDNKETETITVWLDDSDGEFIKRVSEEFNKVYPNIIIQFQHMGTVDAREKLKTYGASGNGADVFQFPHDHMAQAMLEDLVYPLPNDLKTRLETRIIDVAMDIATTAYNESTGQFGGDNEQLFAVPISIESVYLYYNKDLISEDEIPTTWEEIIEFAGEWEKANPGKRFLMTSSHWADSYFTQSIFSAFGFRPFGKNGDDGSAVGFANGEVANAKLQSAINWLISDLRPIVTGNSSHNSVLAAEFEQGKAAICLSGPWSTQTYTNAGINVGAITMPSFNKSTTNTEAATETASTYAGAQMVAVYKYSQHKEAATKFVEFLTTETAAKILYEVGGDCPALKTEFIQNIDEIKNDPIVQVMQKQLETSIPMPTIPDVTYYWGPAESLVTTLWMANPSMDKIAEGLVNAEKSYNQSKAMANK